MNPIPTRYGGTLFRSRVEARWATFFDAAGIRFQYEPDGFRLRPGAVYLPDFWLTDLRLFLEVKGQEPTEEERAKCADLATVTEADVLLAVGPPEERFTLLWFDRGGEREERYVFARDRISACGFWLLAESGGNWIGPNGCGETPKGPMFSGALELAYAAALSARFETAAGQVRHPLIPETDPERQAA